MWCVTDIIKTLYIYEVCSKDYRLNYVTQIQIQLAYIVPLLGKGVSP